MDQTDHMVNLKNSIIYIANTMKVC